MFLCYAQNRNHLVAPDHQQDGNDGCKKQDDQQCRFAQSLPGRTHQCRKVAFFQCGGFAFLDFMDTLY